MPEQVSLESVINNLWTHLSLMFGAAISDKNHKLTKRLITANVRASLCLSAIIGSYTELLPTAVTWLLGTTPLPPNMVMLSALFALR